MAIVIGTGYADYIRTSNSAGANASTSLAFGMEGDDILLAGAFGSTLDGGEGNDTVVAGAGADSFTGGLGNDTFRGQESALNGDTITDFARGDRIEISDATMGSNLAWNGSALTYGATSLALTNLQNASIAVSAAPGGGVQIAYGGPALIVSAGTNVAAAASAASQPIKSGIASVVFDFFDDGSQPLDPHQVRLVDDLFALA